MGSKSGKLNRREFLTHSLTGLAGAGLAGVTGGKLFAQEFTPKADTEMHRKEIIQRTLGRTGLKIPIVSMGVMNASIPNIIQQSYEKGIRLFDTAAVYQNGRNETMVGDVVKKMGIRDKVTIITKEMTPENRNGSERKMRDDLIAGLEASLKRLQTDYVDILCIHSCSTAEDVNHPGFNEGMQILKDRKLIRFSGVTSHQGQPPVLNAIAESGAYDVAIIAFNFALADYPELFTAMDKAAAAGVGLIAMKTQAGGEWWKYVHNEELGEVNQTASLKWALQYKQIATAIPGHVTAEQLEQNFSVAYDFAYTEDEKKYLKSKNVTLGMNFCRQCRSCLASCPKGVDIPSLMRVHMYAAQYRNFDMARYTYDTLPSHKSLAQCRNCGSCTAQCAFNRDIDGRIQELKLIYA